MTDPKRVDIERYLAGEMESEEAAKFLKNLRNDRESLRYLGEVLEQQALLYEILGEQDNRRVSEPSPTGKRRSRLVVFPALAAVAAAAVLVVVLVLVFFPGFSGTTDVAEEETPFTMPTEDKPTIEKKDTTPTPVPEKRVVKETPAPAEKGPKLAQKPAPPVEKESPAPEQPEKKPPFAEKPEQPEKPVAPAREEPKTELAEKEQAPAPVFLAITVDDELKSKGKLQVSRGKRLQTVEAKGGTFLWQADEQIRTTRLACFTTADGTRVLLSKATLVLSSVQPVTLTLERGEIFCEVAPGKKKDEKGETPKTEPGGKATFIVRTKDAEVRVTGTKFGVKYASRRTMVMVTEGEVILANTKGEVTVPACTVSSAVKTSAPRKPKQVKAGKYFGWRYQLAAPVVWRHEFDKIDDKKERIYGELVLLDEPGRKVSAVISEPYKSRAWAAEEKIGIYIIERPKKKDWPGYFFKIPEKCEMRLRIRSEKPGTTELRIYQWVKKTGDDKDKDIFRVGDIPIGPEWKEVVLGANDFKPCDDIQSFQIGLSIKNISIWGFGTGKVYLDWIVVTGKSRK